MAMMGSGTARGDDRAVAAAEAAINNPLLEDVNLSGACGILVNVTAGPNLTMREFDEIGQVVHQFASEEPPWSSVAPWLRKCRTMCA